VAAFLIVSADADLTSMSLWLGRPIIERRRWVGWAGEQQALRGIPERSGSLG
jgi:hypothetical protein